MRGVIAALVVAALAGCGDAHEGLPAGCTTGPTRFLHALATAPGAVRVDGVPISRCFNRSGDASEVQVVGSNLVPVAQQLGEQAARDAEGDAALQLGYLIGAARRGAAHSGVADELLRRLEQEEGDLPRTSQAYARGLAAGRASG